MNGFPGPLPCSLLATLLCVGPAFATEPGSQQEARSLRVHLLSDDDRVELRRSGLEREELVCKTPCDTVVRVQPTDLFTLDGRGLAGSAPFSFLPRNGDITLRVRAGAQGPRILGAALMGAGHSVMVGSALYALPQLYFGEVFCDGRPACKDDNARTRAATLTVFLVGLGVGLTGLLIWLARQPTRFTVEQ